MVRHLIEAYQNQVNLMPSIFESDQQDLKLKEYLLVWNKVIAQNHSTYIYSYRKSQQKQLFL